MIYLNLDNLKKIRFNQFTNVKEKQETAQQLTYLLRLLHSFRHLMMNHQLSVQILVRELSIKDLVVTVAWSDVVTWSDVYYTYNWYNMVPYSPA